MDILTHHELIFSTATVFGMIGHYAKKKVRSETQVTLYQWFGSINVFGTLASLTTAAIAIFGALSNNVVTADMSIATLVYIGLTTGYTIDSTTNGDDTETNRGLKPPKWMDKSSQ
jgi:hypothetical protein